MQANAFLTVLICTPPRCSVGCVGTPPLARAIFATQVVKEFFQRTALSGFALFLSTCLVLGQLIFRSWPAWLAAGEIRLSCVRGLLLRVCLHVPAEVSSPTAELHKPSFQGTRLLAREHVLEK